MVMQFLLLLSIGLGAAADQHRAAQAEHRRLEGTWRQVSKRGGLYTPTWDLEYTFHDHGLRIEAGRMTFTEAGKVTRVAAYALYPLNTSLIDITGWMTRRPREVHQAVYALDGDTLRICYRTGARHRPPRVQDGTFTFVNTYRRVRPPESPAQAAARRATALARLLRWLPRTASLTAPESLRACQAAGTAAAMWYGEVYRQRQRLRGAWRVVSVKGGPFGGAVSDVLALVSESRCDVGPAAITLTTGGQAQRLTYDLLPFSDCHADVTVPFADEPERVYRALYRLDGDSLQVCFRTLAPGQRPTEIADGMFTYVVILARVKAPAR